MSDKENATALLLELAAGCEHPGQVAERLVMLGCTGIPESPCKCPVAIYLNRHGVEHCGLDTYVTFRARPYEYAAVPLIVRRFITKFDYDEYPELRAST